LSPFRASVFHRLSAFVADAGGQGDDAGNHRADESSRTRFTRPSLFPRSSPTREGEGRLFVLTYKASRAKQRSAYS
jgi:hypothetical protein